MPIGYTELDKRPPRSTLFAIVANVGPGGTSRTLAVAYRQANNATNKTCTHFGPVEHFVADTLAIIQILSDAKNTAPLEAEKALAKEWYRRTEVEPRGLYENERPSVPDSIQPPWKHWDWDKDEDGNVDGHERILPSGLQHRPQLPWRGDTLVEFPFTTTCLLLGLLGEDENENESFKATAGESRRTQTRPDDIQLQPLSTVFNGNCLEYGLVVLDISDINDINYGIAAFPVRYMAEVYYHGYDWDPVEDPQPVNEPDAVPFSLRPRELLSLGQWVERYFNYDHMRNYSGFRRLDGMGVVGGEVLDYIWPQEEDLNQSEDEDSDQASLGCGISGIFRTFWPSKNDTRSKKRSTSWSPADMVGYTILDDPPRKTSIEKAKACSITSSASSSCTLLDEPQNVPEDLDSVINDLLALTQQPGPAEASLEIETDSLQILAQFPEKLRQTLEQAPDRLGPSNHTISSHVLRIAYAGHRHLNWVSFQSLTLNIIAAAITCEELGHASALSLCVDHGQGLQARDEGEKDLDDFAAALAKSTNLEQVCFLQQPGRISDDASASFCERLVARWRLRVADGDLGLRLCDESMYSTSAFSMALLGR